MSIVGTQSVSLGELMKLGPQALNAMAQGQINSIAPSYMVLAALKALTDQQKGTPAPAPQGTVKDQVIAQATPPAMAGIGQMMPQQPQQIRGFAQGGMVGWMEEAEKERQRQIAERWRGIQLQADRDAMAHKFSASQGSTEATKPTSINIQPTPQQLEALVKSTPDPTITTEKFTPPAPDTSTRASVKASGISTTRGGNPLEKYSEYNVKEKALADIEGMNAPKNVQLDEQIAAIAGQRDPKVAQLAKEREAAGLAAFGANMLKGRGFGAAFAPAAAASIGAMQEKDKESRALQMRYEDIARELGLKKGTEEYQRFVDNLKYKQEERKFDLDRQKEAWEANFKTTEAGNKEQLELRRLAIMEEANRIQAAVRADANKERYIGVLQQWLANAKKEAADYAETLYGKTDPKTGVYLDPDAPRKKELAITRRYQEMGGPQMEAIFSEVIQRHAGVGIKTLPPTQAGAGTGSRGPLLGK